MHHVESTDVTDKRSVADGSRTDVTDWIEVNVYHEPFERNFAEIRNAKSRHDVVTLIEILSSADKALVANHENYLKKRVDILASNTSLIEIDLLRGGRRDFLGRDIHTRILKRRPASRLSGVGPSSVETEPQCIFSCFRFE